MRRMPELGAAVAGDEVSGEDVVVSWTAVRRGVLVEGPLEVPLTDVFCGVVVLIEGCAFVGDVLTGLPLVMGVCCTCAAALFAPGGVVPFVLMTDDCRTPEVPESAAFGRSWGSTLFWCACVVVSILMRVTSKCHDSNKTTYVGVKPVATANEAPK